MCGSQFVSHLCFEEVRNCQLSDSANLTGSKDFLISPKLIIEVSHKNLNRAFSTSDILMAK